MGLAYVGTPTTGFAHNGTTIACTKPTGVAAGDLLLMAGMGFTSTETATNPAGFSLVKDGANFTTLFARIADGTEGSSFSFTFGSNGDGIGICVAIRGSAATSATAGWFDPATFPAWYDPGTAGATIPVPAITLADSTDWLLGIFGAIGATSQAIGLPSGFTSRVASFGSGTTAGQDIYGAVGDVQSIAAGSTGIKTGSCVSADRFGLIVGIIPAAGTTITGTGGVTEPKPSLAASGTEVLTGSGSVALPTPKLAGTGYEVPSGTGGVVLPKPSLAATAAEVFPGAGGTTLPKPSLAGTGMEVPSGTAAITLPTPKLAAAGTVINGSGTAAVTLPKASLAGSGSVSPAGTGGVALPKTRVAAAGTESIPGTAAVRVPKPSVAAVGAVSQPVTGTAAITVPKPTVSGSSPSRASAGLFVGIPF